MRARHLANRRSTGDAASMRGRRPSPGWIDSAALIVTHLRRDSENGD